MADKTLRDPDGGSERLGGENVIGQKIYAKVLGLKFINLGVRFESCIDVDHDRYSVNLNPSLRWISVCQVLSWFFL